MLRIAAIAPLLLLAACDAEVKAPAANDETVQMKADGDGRVAFNLPFAKGELKLPTGIMSNANFDIDGVKLMPGSSVTGFNLDAHHEGATVNMTFNAPASPDAVRSYFVDQFKEKGVEAALAGDSVTGKSKDGSPFVINVSPAAAGSTGTIEIHSKG